MMYREVIKENTESKAFHCISGEEVSQRPLEGIFNLSELKEWINSFDAEYAELTANDGHPVYKIVFSPFNIREETDKEYYDRLEEEQREITEQDRAELQRAKVEYERLKKKFNASRKDS